MGGDMASDDIARSRLVTLREQLVKDRDIHAANMNAAAGGIQVLDMLLAAPLPEPPVADAPDGAV